MRRLAPLLLALALLPGCRAEREPTRSAAPPPAQWIPPTPQQGPAPPAQVFGAVQGKHKPPRPPSSRPSRVSLFIYEGDTPLPYRLADLGVTDVIWTPTVGAQALCWAGTDDAIRASAAKAQSLGLPWVPFCWSFSANNGVGPWNASEPDWQAFLHRLTVWRQAGAAGVLLDVEDYPGWGVRWWNNPASATLPAARALQYAAVVGQAAFCGSFFKLAGTNRSNPPTVRSNSLFQFVNVIPSSRWLEEETYRWGPYSNASTVTDYWRPWVAGGFPRAAYVPGIFLRTPEDLALFPYAGSQVFAFTMPGALRDAALRTALAKALGR